MEGLGMEAFAVASSFGGGPCCFLHGQGVSYLKRAPVTVKADGL